MNHKVLPRDTALAQLASADQVDVVCDAFEAAWVHGDAPRIEDFLDRSDVSLRESLLVELLLVDREYRAKRGENAGRHDYQRRFPAYSLVIESVDFATIDDRVGETRSNFRAQPSAAPGGTIAHFELVSELGAGATGTVWKACDTRLQRLVALKIPRQEMMTGLEREQFLREGQACAQLRHPNLVAIHEVGDDRGRVFIVAEFIEGLNLREWLSQRRPTPRQAAELAAQLAEGLHHAHELGVIHRDLKPANVLIDSQERPHITDFGLAKRSNDSAGMTVEGNILGTPAYMSPEQAQGNAFSVDRRTDIYGLGALLYELLTGRPPFEGEVAAIVHQVIHDEPLAPRKVEHAVPHDLETICLKAMEKVPNRRYLSAQEMAVDLRRYLRGEPILSRRIGLLEKGWRWLRRRPAAATALVLALVAISSLAVAGLFAIENHELLGLRTVTLATDPPGARVAFLPLSETTGEPMLSMVTYAGSISPVREELRPGDYFVVAVLSDGTFHEVFRHVPSNSEQVPGAYNHAFWEVNSDQAVTLPTVVIPQRPITNGMAYIEGHESFAMGIAGSAKLPAFRTRVESFFVDTSEFTFGDFKRIFSRVPKQYRGAPLMDDWAIPVNYDQAVAYAELVGKRLPTEAEFEFVATARGSLRYPWGSDLPDAPHAPGFGSVKSILFDKTNTDPPVYGLCSNVAEWTCSWAVPYPPHASTPAFVTLAENRVVRGGGPATIAGDPAISAEERDPRHRIVALRFRSQPGTGFRCVRSSEPCIPYGEFP